MGQCKCITQDIPREELQIVPLQQTERLDNQPQQQDVPVIVSRFEMEIESIQSQLEQLDSQDGYVVQEFNGYRYEGQLIDGKMHNRGKLICTDDGSYYEGQFDNGIASGSGQYYNRNGDKYSGQWRSNKQEGEGKEVFVNGTTFKGQFADGRRCGLGLITFPDGSSYSGKFYDNAFNGYGIYTWVDGKVYEGTWQNNQMHGKGVIKWSDGREFHCIYECGRRHGEGKYIWPDNKVLVANWRDGQLCGVVRLELGDVVSYGECKDDSTIKWFI